MLFPPKKRIRLTEREWAVIKMLAEGTVPRDIAENLEISAKTVSLYVNNIQLKLHLDNRLVLQNLLLFLKKECSHMQYPCDVMSFSRIASSRESMHIDAGHEEASRG